MRLKHRAFDKKLGIKAEILVQCIRDSRCCSIVRFCMLIFSRMNIRKISMVLHDFVNEVGVNEDK